MGNRHFAVYTWVVVKIRVPFWVLLGAVLYQGPKRDPNSTTHMSAKVLWDAPCREVHVDVLPLEGIPARVGGALMQTSGLESFDFYYHDDDYCCY